VAGYVTNGPTMTSPCGLVTLAYVVRSLARYICR